MNLLQPGFHYYKCRKCGQSLGELLTPIEDQQTEEFRKSVAKAHAIYVLIIGAALCIGICVFPVAGALIVGALVACTAYLTVSSRRDRALSCLIIPRATAMADIHSLWLMLYFHRTDHGKNAVPEGNWDIVIVRGHSPVDPWHQPYKWKNIPEPPWYDGFVVWSQGPSGAFGPDGPLSYRGSGIKH